MDKKYLKPDEIVATKTKVNEQETTICIERNSDTVRIWSCDNTEITRLKKTFTKNPDIWKCWAGPNLDGAPSGYYFECTKNCISYRAGAQREVSEEQKQAVAERFKKIREQKRS